MPPYHPLMAAVISSTALASTSFLSVDAKFNHGQLQTAKCLSRRRRHRLSVSNTVENIPESSSSSEVVDKDSSSSVLPPRSFTSLITSSNIKKALEGVECVSVDHYARLGIPRGCSYAEVREAFKTKCQDLMQQELDEEKAQSKIQDLKESYEILSSEEERRFYDWSLARVENKERYVWPYEVDITQRSSAQCPPQATVEVPDLNGHKAILKVNASNKKLGKHVLLDVVAMRTLGFSGADLANLLNEATILAGRRGKKYISSKEIDDTIDRIVVGMEGTTITDGKSKSLAAYDEVGHEICALSA